MRTRVATIVGLLAGLATMLSGCGPSGSSGPKVGAAACHWHVRHAHPSTTDDLTGLSFPDASHGWAVGGIDGPTIRVTSDGGQTWHAQHGPGGNGLNSVSFPDDRHGWAVGIDNLVLSTDDGGTHWTPEHPLPVGGDHNLYGVWFVNDHDGWIVGSRGTIEQTTDGGRSWSDQRSPTSQDLQSVQFANTRVGWIISDGEVLRTSNGGRSWTHSLVSSSQSAQIFAGLDFISPSVGWVAGSQTDGSANHGVIFHTTDGGRRWKLHDITNFDDVRFGAVAFSDARHGWVAGYQGELFYTDNGGTSWAEHDPSTIGNRIYALAFADPTHGWAVGQVGTILACTA